MFVRCMICRRKKKGGNKKDFIFFIKLAERKIEHLNSNENFQLSLADYNYGQVCQRPKKKWETFFVLHIFIILM